MAAVRGGRPSPAKERTVARNAYDYEKRQKELLKQKREEKGARRAECPERDGKGPSIAKVNEFGEVIDSDVRRDAGQETKDQV